MLGRRRVCLTVWFHVIAVANIRERKCSLRQTLSTWDSVALSPVACTSSLPLLDFWTMSSAAYHARSTSALRRHKATIRMRDERDVNAGWREMATAPASNQQKCLLLFLR